MYALPFILIQYIPLNQRITRVIKSKQYYNTTIVFSVYYTYTPDLSHEIMTTKKP